MKNNHLSDIYSQKVLLNEEKSPVVKGAKELESKIGKAGLVGNQGPEKSKKGLETPEENKKYSDGAKAKTMKESAKSYEGAFEKLFKATITEQEMDEPGVEMEVEVPTEPEGMVDEIESEESGDLVSELRDIVDRLQEVLANLSDEDSDENELENESGESEEGENEEEPYEESDD